MFVLYAVKPGLASKRLHPMKTSLPLMDKWTLQLVLPGCKSNVPDDSALVAAGQPLGRRKRVGWVIGINQKYLYTSY